MGSSGGGSKVWRVDDLVNGKGLDYIVGKVKVSLQRYCESLGEICRVQRSMVKWTCSMAFRYRGSTRRDGINHGPSVCARALPLSLCNIKPNNAQTTTNMGSQLMSMSLPASDGWVNRSSRSDSSRNLTMSSTRSSTTLYLETFTSSFIKISRGFQNAVDIPRLISAGPDFTGNGALTMFQYRRLTSSDECIESTMLRHTPGMGHV
jgi:hypothetical protein